MNLSFLSPARTVLIISDEALYIYSMSPRGVSHVETVPWDVENFQNNVAGILAKDCGGKPVLILNDTVEQHYRKERVPKVGVLDKANVIKRKLKVAFPNYDIRAALTLKEKAGKTTTGLSSAIYIFAAIPATENFIKTIEAVRTSLASIVGVCLLPVEASDMVKALSTKVSKQNKAQWAVFIGQHKNGSLRQVVIKNGELALTRMTPIVETDENSTQWAGEVNQEFKATMSYLSRFGFSPSDGLDVIVIANEEAGEKLGSIIDASCNYTSLNVAQAAQLLGVPLGRQEGSHYADILHAAWIGQKKRLILPMSAKQISAVSVPRKAAMAASLLMVLCAGYLGYELFNAYSGLGGVREDIKTTNQQKNQLDNQYRLEVQRKKEAGFDVELVQNSLIIYDGLEDQKMNLFGLFKGIGDALGRDLRIDKIDVVRTVQTSSPQEVKGNRRGVEQEVKTPLYKVAMRLTYPSTTNIDKGNAEVRALRDRLQEFLPDHKVRVDKYLKDYEYTEGVVVEAGDLNKRNITQDFVVELSILGPEK